jgi:hypothetical protein
MMVHQKMTFVQWQKLTSVTTSHETVECRLSSRSRLSRGTLACKYQRSAWKCVVTFCFFFQFWVLHIYWFRNELHDLGLALEILWLLVILPHSLVLNSLGMIFSIQHACCMSVHFNEILNSQTTISLCFFRGWSLPTIPIQPLSYSDAEPLLRGHDHICLSLSFMWRVQNWNQMFFFVVIQL